MKLKKGDLIGVISPSWCGPEIFTAVYKSGLENINSMGYKIKEYSYTTKQGTPKERAEDIHKAFTDDETKAVFITIGGDDCMLLLPHLDISLLKNNAKPIMGYSDATALFAFISQHNIPCYYGPTVMAGFAQILDFPNWYNYVQNIIQGGQNSFNSFPEYSNGYKDWGEVPNKVKEKISNEGFHFLTNETGSGKLFGGCLEVLEFLKETPYFPPIDFWNDKILFLETSEEVPKPTEVKRILRNYGLAGILARVKGLLFGRARDYTRKEKEELDEIIMQVLAEFNISIPVVTNIDFGHTDPQLILKYGSHVHISENKLDYL